MSVLISALVWRTALPPMEKLVALSLADQANDEGECWPGRNSLTARCSVSKRTTQNATSKLAERRLLEIDEQSSKRGTNVYRFNLPRLHRLARDAGDAPPRAGGAPPGGAGGAPEPPEDPNRKYNPPNPPSGGATTLLPVFEAWKQATGRNGTTALGGKRVKAIKGRLGEGFTVEQLVAAVQAIPRSDFHNGRDPKTRDYDKARLARLTELTLHLRDAEHVEYLLALAGAAPAPSEHKTEAAPRIGYVATDEELLGDLKEG